MIISYSNDFEVEFIDIVSQEDKYTIQYIQHAGSMSIFKCKVKIKFEDTILDNNHVVTADILADVDIYVDTDDILTCMSNLGKLMHLNTNKIVIHDIHLDNIKSTINSIDLYNSTRRYMYDYYHAYSDFYMQLKHVGGFI